MGMLWAGDGRVFKSTEEMLRTSRNRLLRQLRARMAQLTIKQIYVELETGTFPYGDTSYSGSSISFQTQKLPGWPS
jgi:hypothetical protein